ncbi:DUF6515 family protein [Granulosicoccaceae sp. 1_MG-2023]|nr:DUF6515 family protein [Granulosicoccaceae sp. 1_MG-2023]
MLISSLVVLPASAAPGHAETERHKTYRYPSRGAVVDQLPRAHRIYSHNGRKYHLNDGVWYRSVGNRYMVVTPPVGLVLPALPVGAVLATIAGVEYYRYGSVYYKRGPDGYRVVETPAENTQVKETVSDDLFVYPRQGQSVELQASDRFECHEWAGEQTGYDPTLSGGGVSADQRSSKRSEYQRAMTACLEARGYSVR